MNSREISAYKRKIMKYLIADVELVGLLDPAHETEYPDELLYKKIFPFNRVPATEEEVSVYVTVMVDIPRVYDRNDIARSITVTIRIYAHESLMGVDGQDGDRTDLISVRIDEMLNESFDFGIGYMTLVSNTEHVLDSKHHYREIVFKTDALNSRRDGVNQWSP